MTTVDDAPTRHTRIEPRDTGVVRRLLGTRSIVCLLAAATALAGLGLFAPRFGVHSPSLVDDWFAISYSPPAVHELLHGHYVTSLVDYGGRYRPAYAVLAYFQWIVLGDHGHSTLLPTLFGLARLLFFMAVVAGVTVVLLRGRTSKVQAAVWGSLASVVIVWTPGIATSFVRFGVAEPTGLALVALSLLVMIPAIRSLALEEGGRLRVGQLLRLMGGYVLYLFGVYMWEALVAVIIVLPALYFWIRQGPRARGTSRRMWWVIGAAAVLLTAPLVHITTEVLVNGHLGASSAGAGQHRLLPALLGGVLPTLGGALTQPQSLLCLLLPFYVIPRCARAAQQGDRTALICLATLGAGLLAAYISYAGAETLSRYYIPWIAALVVTGAWSFATSSHRRELSIAALALMSLTLVVGRPDTRVANWINGDRTGTSAITVASKASATGCRVYLVGFPPEQAVGVARLIRSADRSPLTACSRGSRRALAVRWPALKASPPSGCVAGWRTAVRRGQITLLACRDFRTTARIPTQDAALTRQLTVVRLVRPPHLVPASSLNRFSFNSS